MSADVTARRSAGSVLRKAMGALARVIETGHPRLRPPDAGICLWALATAQVYNQVAVEQLCQHIRLRVERTNLRTAGNVLWSLAALLHDDPQLLNDITARAARVVEEVNPSGTEARTTGVHVVQVLLAMAKLGGGSTEAAERLAWWLSKYWDAV